VNIEQFTTLLINSGLFGEREARELAGTFQEACRDRGDEDSVETFSEFLVATDRLTRWQCDKLRMGKWKGFYLDNFLLLEQIGKDHESSSYKARNARDGNVMCLVVTPFALSKSGRIEYRVEPYAGS
jgi:hypothetical protein